MKYTAIIPTLFRFAFRIVLAAVLALCAVLMILYSGWGQERLRTSILAALNSQPGTEARLDRLSLTFPLTLDIGGLLLVQDGDTVMAASEISADVSLLPLLKGEIGVNSATLSDARMRIGHPDSALCMTIDAGSLDIRPARVRLSDMDIDIADGALSHAHIDIVIGVDTAATPVDTASTQMAIHLRRLRLTDVTYSMSMMPVFTSLTAAMPECTITDGNIDMGAQTVDIASFTGRGLDLRYIVPDSAAIAAYPVVPEDTTATEPWTINIATIDFTSSRALYATQGVEPAPGLDFEYISADSLALHVTDFYNREAVINAPLRLSGIERCGIALDIAGTLATDEAALYLKEFDVATPCTDLHLDAMMGSSDMTTDPSTPLSIALDGYASFTDLKKMFPGFALYMNGFGDRPLDISLDAAGTSGHLDIRSLVLDVTGAMRLTADGDVTDIFGDTGMDLDLGGKIADIHNLIDAILGNDSGISIPPMTLGGHLRMASGDIDGRLDARTAHGRLALDATLKGKGDVYTVAVDADKFPVNAFMPALGVGNATIRLDARGNGFDLLNPRTSLEARLDVGNIVYEGVEYHDFNLAANVDKGQASVAAKIDNPGINLDLKANGNLTGDTYIWDAMLDGSNIDLLALKLSETAASLSASLTAHASYSPKAGEIKANIAIPSAVYEDDMSVYDLSDIDVRFTANDSITDLRINNRDLRLTACALVPLDSITVMTDRAMAVLDKQISRHELKIDSIQEVLPPFEINLEAGADNFINAVLGQSDMSVERMAIHARNAADLSLTAFATGFTSGDMKLDSISANISQEGDRMNFKASLDNRPGTLDDFAHVSLNGVLNSNKAALRITQADIEGATGYDLGVNAVLSDSVISTRIFPLDPTIGYRKWKVNLDNYVHYNYFTHHIDANLKMRGGTSEIALFTNHNHQGMLPGAGHTAVADSIDHDGHEDNDVNLRITDVHLQDFISFNPFAPPITGDLSADMHLIWDGGTNINGDGTVTLADFFYGKQRVGTLAAALDVSTNLDGMIRAKARFDIDGRRTMELSGNLNDTVADSPFKLDLRVIEFPLSIGNPFLTKEVAQLQGTLNGHLDITGDTGRPLMNGEIYFLDAAAQVAATNTQYTFSGVHIPMVDNIVSFNDFSISGANDRPLRINGKVDLSSISAPAFDITMKADGMMAMNTNRAGSNAMLYGKLLLSLDASLRGNMSFANVKAAVSVLSGTNVTYILDTSPEEYTAASMGELVKFVNLSDTAAVMQADSIDTSAMMLMLNASLNIQTGTTLTIDLPSSTRDKVVLQPQGSLNYTQLPMSDGRMTGRLNIDGGNVHYTLPVIGSEKDFTFQSGSYVAFNGDILNPVLNISAVDRMKANVTQSGQNSRLIDFDVTLGVTGTLETMNVAFDLSTEDDITVANELQAMTPAQRANQAMNLLLYGMYTGPGTTADASLTVNPLYSFLESQINNWAARNIKGVDLSFGIDQYNQTTNGTSSTTMNYSYRVSKTLFNDRFKIVVGGNYSTDDNADENISENLINDISFEYYLNSQQTMLLKIFRHTGYESILEGEVTQTGVGFVYKRKLNRLSQMLPKFLRPRRKPTAPQ